MSAKNLSLIILIGLFWAIGFPLIEIGHRAAPPLVFAAIRSLIAGLVLIIPVILLNEAIFFNKAVWLYGLGVGLTYTAMGFNGKPFGENKYI